MIGTVRLNQENEVREWTVRLSQEKTEMTRASMDTASSRLARCMADKRCRSLVPVAEVVV